MKFVSCFDPKKDEHEVDQFGFIDLVSALENGAVVGDVDLRGSSFNEIADPNNVASGKPSDIFDAIKMSRGLQPSGETPTA